MRWHQQQFKLQVTLYKKRVACSWQLIPGCTRSGAHDYSFDRGMLACAEERPAGLPGLIFATSGLFMPHGVLKLT